MSASVDDDDEFGKYAALSMTLYSQNPDQWNSLAERCLTLLPVGADEVIPPYFQPKTDEQLTRAEMEQERLQCTWHTRHAIVAALQAEALEDIKIALENEDLERKWLELGAAKQRKYMWSGLTDTLDMDEGLITVRFSTPEVHLTDLLKDSGRPFLALLKTSVQGISRMNSAGVPFIFGSASHNAFLAKYGAYVVPPPSLFDLMQWSLGRTHFIATFLWSTVRRYLSDCSKSLTIATHRSRRFVAAYAAEMDQPICEGCWKVADDRERNILRCQRCARIGRQWYYCSAECQKSRWPSHKRMCGRLLSHVDNPDVASEWNLPSLPQSRFSRSPALKKQIAAIEANPHIDYMLEGADDDEAQVRLEAGAIRSLFRRHRYLAMWRKDPEAILAMWATLCTHLGFDRYEGQDLNDIPLSRQFGAEYGEETMNEVWDLWDNRAARVEESRKPSR